MSVFNIMPHELPAVRIAQAIGKKSDKNILLVVGGGLGDVVCAEPTVRYCIENFKDCSFSLRCDTPEMFAHLKFRAVYRSQEEIPKTEEFLAWYTYAQGSLANQFFNPNMMNSVDFSSISAIRCQLPISYREPKISCETPSGGVSTYLRGAGRVILHVGKSWNSRTFPAAWWNDMINKMRFVEPVLIGKNCIEGIDPTGCIDLRDKLSLNDYIWLCQNSWGVITNDSSPLHFAATGRPKIAFVPTCRSGDHLLHWRGGELGWRMKAFYKEKMWDLFKDKPNHLKPTSCSEVPPGCSIDDFLPNTRDIADWIMA